MKYALLLVFFVASVFGFSKGSQGTYTIAGIAYGPDSVVLKNVELTVKFGKETKVIKTDETGSFIIEVKWSTTCGTKLTEEQEKEEMKKMNPEFIYVRYKRKEIKIKNTWEKYVGLLKDKVVKKHDLHY